MLKYFGVKHQNALNFFSDGPGYIYMYVHTHTHILHIYVMVRKASLRVRHGEIQGKKIPEQGSIEAKLCMVP